MNQRNEAWEKEYRKPTFLTKKDTPQKDILKTLSLLKKERNFSLENRKVLDLGCGVGRNSNYLASLGNSVWGIDISKTAIVGARKNALEKKLTTIFKEGDIGSPLPFQSNFFDLILDITSSNSLNEKGRGILLEEISRIILPSGYVIVKGLLKDGDKNAHNLIKQFPGQEYDTYTIPTLHITERVFIEKDFKELYGKIFTIVSFVKKTSYTRMNSRVYKRNFFIAILQKK